MRKQRRVSGMGLAIIMTIGGAVGVTAALPGGASGAPSEHAKVDRDLRIELKSRSFTPAPGLQKAAIAGQRGANAKVHYIAQFAPLPSAADRKAFNGKGVKLLASLGGSAYLASSSVGHLKHLSSFPGFRWAGPLQAADKIDPTLAGGRTPAHVRTSDGVALTVQVHADESIASAVAIARKHGARVFGVVPTIPSVSAVFPRAAVDALAAEDAVQYVAPLDAPLDDHNDGAVGALNAGPTYTAPYNLNGTGVTVLVYDSGLAQHSDFDARITVTDPDAAAPTRSHSTHVAGTVLGNGANSAGTDSAGGANNGTANQWAGLATAANLATFASLGTSPSTDVLYDDAGDINVDFATAITGGADLGTMSQGNNTGPNGFPCTQLGDYTNTSILIDQIVAGSTGAPFIFFQSAGNERGQACDTVPNYSTISSPAPAKNSIVVGAINSNDNTMTNFSSWGPTDDGRLRPDLTGPGCQNGGDNNIWSTDFIDDGDGNLEPTEATNAYSGKCGTSMATPALAGVGALMVQHWRNTYGAATTPLPSDMKALLAHTATDLGNPGPDYAFGYGQPDAQAAADLIGAGNLIQDDDVANGATDTWYFTSDGATAPRVTIAWSDPAATRASTTQLVNDVDLRVTRPDNTVHQPQVLDPANPANNSVEGDDNLNVMEMVLGTAQAGTWKVEVVGTSVPTGPQQYTLITPTEATENAPPVADAGGPYTTDEGASVELDGTGSSDPEGGALTYDWDLDNNGSFETLNDATPIFPAKGQDGPYTVVLRVTDPEGGVATDTAVVNVTNVAPTVTVDPITAIDEFGTASITGTITDPGWLDPITATIDFDDGAGAVALSGTLENVEPTATFTFSVNKQYGDNGDFTVTVTGYDDDTSDTGSATASVANVNPTAVIDSSGEQVYDGVSAFVLEKGENLTIPASSTDPGSDDLTFTWDWDDGTTTSETSLVNDPALDPAKSPSVQPRNVNESSTHAYAMACLFELGLAVEDDDGGSGSDSAAVVVTGNGTEAKGHGWWLNEYRAKRGNNFTAAQLECYLDIVDFFSMVFSEKTSIANRAAATKVLNAPAKSPEAVIFDQHALGAWLNFANGSVKLDTPVDTNNNGIDDSTFGAVMFAAESVRINPASTSAQVKAQKNIIAAIITQSD